MKQIPSTLGLLLVLTLSLPANAAEEAGAPTRPPAGDWSLGAGILVPGLTYSPIGHVGSLSAYTTAPSTSMALERRLRDTLWLTLGVSGSVSTVDDPVSLDNGSTVATNALDAEISAGLRYILNPREAVEVSVFGGLALSWTDVDMKTDTEEWTNRTLSYGMVAGLALERRLLDNLTLRLHTTIGNVYYSSVESEVEGTPGTTRLNQFRGGVALSPGIQLRLTF